MRILIFALVLPFSISSFSQKLTSYVDPFLGTGGHGHVYPGATVPFGMVQLSPDNGVEGWDWCSGYHYSSNTIAGFSHTHLSGTGIGDWCDISVLPLLKKDSIYNEKIKIPFSHDNEKASPGYYKVTLNNGIQCELTATERMGLHRYTFPKGEDAYIRFDMGFAINWDKPTDGMLTIHDDSTIVGYRYSTGWAKGQKVYFAAKFSSKLKQYIELNDTAKGNWKYFGKNVKLIIKFDAIQQVNLKVAISSVSVENALEELVANKKLTFETAQKMAEAKWEKELQKIQLGNTVDIATKQKFYTALYRTCLAPVIHSDADGGYQTHDNKNLKFTKGKNKYTIFSQWDVFRALSPLFTITQTERVPDMINSMLQLYEDNGLLPVWDISTWEANTMTGYHSVPIIADAILKNINGFDYNKAYEAMRKSAFQNQRGTQDYIKYGYLPQDKHGWSVTYTLEYAFDDWCIAQVAKKLGKQEDYKLFSKRALAYQYLFDAKTGFMRAKTSDGKFVEPFDPVYSEHGFDGQYVEGTAWQHSFFVPHDVEGLAKLYGGKNILIAKLKELFSTSSELHGKDVSVDISGLIGQYAHGNEPSHHIAYMFSALGDRTSTYKYLQEITSKMYQTGPDGLSGNDDCGQMSAWYIWTVLGMYPMNPASGQYVFGMPMVENATINLPNQKVLAIKVNHINKAATDGEPALHIRRILLNGKEIKTNYITHTQLLQGGELIFEMG